MSPGGPEEIALLFQGSDPSGREVLDVGCGVGGIDSLLARQEVERLCGPRHAELARRMDPAVPKREIEVWRAMIPVVDSGELRPGHIRAVKPAA